MPTLTLCPTERNPCDCPDYAESMNSDGKRYDPCRFCLMGRCIHPVEAVTQVFPGVRTKTCPQCRSIINYDWQEIDTERIMVTWRCACGYSESEENFKTLFF